MKNNKVMHDVTYGMYIVTANGDKKVGCVINTLCQITSGINPLVSISLNKENYTHDVIKSTGKFGVSILSENIDPNIISTFGFSTSKEKDKFEDVDFKVYDNIPIISKDTVGYLVCEVVDIIDCDTHNIILGKVTDGDKYNDLVPMSYKYYHDVIKGSAPKKAPTYVAPEINSSNTEQWICSVCGYIHNGELKEDFVCPICGRPKEVFERK